MVKDTRKRSTGVILERTDQSKDISGKEVFSNNELCAQLLRDYSHIPLLVDVKPEDIEDVPERYHLFGEVEYQSDCVKRVRMHIPDETGDIPLYFVALIEHKSDVDYNISMQLLKYMVSIWLNWEKECRKRHFGDSRRKGFRYPPILPVVYYESPKSWTADLHFKERVLFSDVIGDFIPDFTYKILNIHDYSNQELLEKGNGLSLVMMLNKIQTSKDFQLFKNLPQEKIQKIVDDSSENVLETIVGMIQNLCHRINIPKKEEDEVVKKVKERKMTYFFENMEKMDIQAERRKTEEQKERANKLEKELEKQRKRADEAEALLRKNGLNIE